MTDLMVAAEVHLPEPVEEMLRIICQEQSQPEPDVVTKRKLASLDQAEALRILGTIRHSVIRKSLDHFIIYLVNKTRSAAVDASPPSNQLQGRRTPGTSSSISPRGSTPNQRKRQTSCFSGSTQSPSKQRKILDFFAPHVDSAENDISNSVSEDLIDLPPTTARLDKADCPSPLLEELHKLEFRKAFLLLSYIGRNKLENVASADEIHSLSEFAKSAQMGEFESRLWFRFGNRY